jgi:DNA-binding LacI/PurR family transcriptional regulator
VSAVINKTRYVSPEIEERVRRAMADLAYEPNAIARGLKFSRTFTIGLLLPNIRSPFWPGVLQGIEDCARDHKYNVLFYSTSENEEQEMAGLGLFLGRRVDGILVAPAGQKHAEFLARLDSTSMPVVLLDRRLDSTSLDSVTVDNERGAYTVVKHLLEAGRRRVAAITIPETISTGRDRVAGYRRALAEFALPFDRSLVRTTSFTVEESRFQALKLFDLAEPPDAVFATNHSAVIGTLHAMKDLGKQVPDEVAIVGFDDHPWMSLLDPPLTTISQPMYDLGVQATELLIRRIESQGRDNNDVSSYREPQQLVLETVFVHRRSCGC